MKYLIYLIFSFFIFTPFSIQANELVQDKVEIVKAQVIEVLNQDQRDIPVINKNNIYQTITVKILEGAEVNKIITIDNDFVLLEKGDKFFLYHSVDALVGQDTYSVRDIDRSPVILFFVVLFIAVVVLFSGKKGLYSLIGLAGSFFVILYVLIPSLLNGYPPMLTSIVIATIILFFAVYFTHGFNRVSTVAFTGTVLAVILTGVLAYVGVMLAHFSGFYTEEAFYLDLNTKGTLDFTGLLLGGIMIGVLGVLDDIAITQTAVVNELYKSASHLSQREIYKKALHVGKEHIGALVNTLALAYTGASLPLLLLFSNSDLPMISILNQEIFSTEIIRTIVGSIGLILTVPITTLLAVYALKGQTLDDTSHGHHLHI